MEHICIIIMSCKVMVDNCLSDSLDVRSGVIKGGVLSLLLFVLVIDSYGL